MGFQGTLDSVSFGDIFQTIAANRQTGTMSITTPQSERHIWFRDGSIAMVDGPMVDGMPELLHSLLSRGFMTKAQADELYNRSQSSGQGLRELIVASGYVNEPDLDYVCQVRIEDSVCEVFEWHQGNFVFNDGEPVEALQVPEVLELGENPLPTASVVMEATRRQDEWGRIRQVIPNDDELYVVDNDGRSRLNQIENDPDMLKVLRYLDGRHRLDRIATNVGLSRFDAFAIVSQLVLNQIARACTSEEIINNAMEMRANGDLHNAMDLLDIQRARYPSPEVILPMAEMSIQVNDIPAAVELYLELVQLAQDNSDFENALIHLETVIQLSPDDPELRIDRAVMLIELDRMDEAADSYIKAAEDFLLIRNTNDAIDCCHRARDLQPRSADPHRLLAKAYIIEGQTENAAVEYKALWHALLTGSSPRRALTVLEEILEEDCKYQSVKQQVLEHARGSDAVKTGKAVRRLISVITIIIIAVAAIFGKGMYEDFILIRDNREQLKSGLADFELNPAKANYPELLDMIHGFQGKHLDNQEWVEDVDQAAKSVKDALEKYASIQVSEFEVAVNNKDFKEANRLLRELKSGGRFADAEAANKVSQLIEKLTVMQDSTSAEPVIESASTSWRADEWDEAISELQNYVNENKHLHISVLKNINTMVKEWSFEREQSESLYRRAERIENKRSKQEAIIAFKLALNGKGERFKERARKRLEELESEQSKAYVQLINDANTRNDANQVFAYVDEFKALVDSAISTAPKTIFNDMTLSCLLHIDHAKTSVIVTDSQGNSKTLTSKNPQGSSWDVRVNYSIDDKLTITAKRDGFDDMTVTIESDLRIAEMSLELQRGPTWRTDLQSQPVAPVTLTDDFAIVPLKNNSLSLVDKNFGNARDIQLEEGLGEFSGSPYIFRDVLYIPLGERIYAIDLNTRGRLWTYPPINKSGLPSSFSGGVWVQEHELIQNEIQVFAGSKRGDIITLAVESPESINTYPTTRLPSDISGPVLADGFDGIHSTVYIPARNILYAYDATSASQSSALKYRYRVEMRGDITTRPVRCNVKGRAGLLITDSSGFITAIDADPSLVIEPVEAIGSWPLDGGLRSGPAVDNESHTAYVSLTKGRVVAIDLNSPGKLLWQFPESGTLGTLYAKPAIGSQGIYIADSKGYLICIDKKSGKERWRYDLGSPSTYGCTVHNGRVLVVTNSGTLSCFLEGND